MSYQEERVKIVEKPWGRELWIAHTDKYALKIIEFKQGARSSLQYHNVKHEHVYVDRGLLEVEWENEQGEMETLRRLRSFRRLSQRLCTGSQQP